MRSSQGENVEVRRLPLSCTSRPQQGENSKFSCTNERWMASRLRKPCRQGRIACARPWRLRALAPLKQWLGVNPYRSLVELRFAVEFTPAQRVPEFQL